jgi:hypothetical protein
MTLEKQSGLQIPMIGLVEAAETGLCKAGTTMRSVSATSIITEGFAKRWYTR